MVFTSMIHHRNCSFMYMGAVKMSCVTDLLPSQRDLCIVVNADQLMCLVI